jgi:predicted nucleic acid-binding protein
VTIVLDTSAVIALYADDDAHHPEAARWAQESDEELVTTPLAVAEMDYVLRARGGAVAQRALWSDLEKGAIVVRWWANGMAETLGAALERPRVGLTDASLVALAGMLRTDRIFTFDADFRQMTTPRGEPFVLLPADA